MVDTWINTVPKASEEHNLHQYSIDDLAKRLSNADETGLCLATRSMKVLAQRGIKAVLYLGAEPCT